jgi:hypothetical protein
VHEDLDPSSQGEAAIFVGEAHRLCDFCNNLGFFQMVTVGHGFCVRIVADFLQVRCFDEISGRQALSRCCWAQN